MTDRDNVIDELVRHIKLANYVDSDYVECVRTDLLQKAVLLLTGQKAGDWMTKEPKYQSEKYSRKSYCSVCGGWGRKSFSFCPHCGAEMRGSKDVW